MVGNTKNLHDNISFVIQTTGPIRSLTIYQKNGINGLQIQDGTTDVQSTGDFSGTPATIVFMDREYITSISVSYTKVEITQLLIKTNITTHGPYGKKDYDAQTKEFSMSGGALVGILGYSNSSNVTAIGFVQSTYIQNVVKLGSINWFRFVNKQTGNVLDTYRNSSMG